MKRLSLLLVLVAAPAFAQEDAPETFEGRPVHRPLVQNVEFDGVNVDAGVVKPEGVLTLERRATVFPPMIVVRASFEPEMVRSIDELR